MATINLGKVKGEPFRYEDFTEEQLKALKGKDFKYEDFSPEQLEGLRSKIKVGVVETLDADEQVRVTPRVEGNTTTLDFAIPRGNGVNSYSGTREQYESEKESIKDGSLVNITDENDFEDETLIGADTLRRVYDIESNMANIKPHAFSNPTNNLLATEPGTALDAVQGKALNDMITAVNLARMGGRQYSTLEDFVKATATDISVPHYFRFKDLGGFMLGKSNSWYRILIQYQNPYSDDVTYNIGGTGILWDDDNVYRVFIGGTKATGVSLTPEKLTTETELNNILGNYLLSACAINSKTTHGLYILLGVAGRNGDVDAISSELKNLGFTTMDNTINDLISILTSNGTDKKQQYIRLEVNNNNSNFNKSLPGIRQANVLEIHLQGNGRGYVRCFYLSDATEYTANITNGAIGGWWKAEKTQVT